MSEVEVAAGGNAVLGESPVWSPDEAALYWVDINNPTVHRLDPATGERKRWLIETETGSIGLAGPGRLVAGLRTGLHFLDLETGKIEKICDPEGEGRFNENRMNDGKVDRAGRFWVGTMNDPGHEAQGTLWRIDGEGNAEPMMREIRIPNALCWSPDSSVMYFTDSYSHQIWAFDFDLEEGTFENKRVFAAIPEDRGVPDGATVDAEGFVWCAHMFGGKVSRFAPDGGVERTIELPVPQVTSCAFGGPDLDTLYITTASLRMDRAALAEQPLSGALFAADPGVRGLPEPAFGA